MSRQNIAAGNWKMNKTFQEGQELAQALVEKFGNSDADALMILGTPYTHLAAVKNIIKDSSNIKLAAQNCHQNEKGAFTGEISIDMLQSVGVDYVILGHSERREYFGEDAELLAKKVDIVLSRGLKPIFCCGEKLEIREAGNHEKLVGEQIKDALFHLDEAAFSNVVIAYEPVWAIGTGVTASPEQAQEMHAFIRRLLATKYGKDAAEATSILYGGSVKPANAKELFANKDVDGGLVGGASLKADDFVAIANSF